MSEITGNPHYEVLIKGYSVEDPHEHAIVQTEATLALTYEQHTANLLGLFMHIDRQGDMPDHASLLFNEIADRLGLRDRDE